MRPVVGTRMRSALLMSRRGFASSARRLDKYGFIGLGQMVSVAVFNLHLASQIHMA